MPSQRTLQIQSHNVQSGAVHLELRRCNSGTGGTPLLLVPGFLKTNDVFMPVKGEGGLAPFLARLGYDVFMAELRGRGKSWPEMSRGSEWGVHEAICLDLRAHLRMIERLRPGVPQVWLGQDFSSLLLVGRYARGELVAPVKGMIHLNASRQRLPGGRGTRLQVCFSLAARMCAATYGYVARPRQAGCKETRSTLNCLLAWQSMEAWLDPVDGFDYAAALQAATLPSSLYMVNEKSSLWGRLDDCRHWVSEMGAHDARIVTVGRRGGNQRNYSHRELIQHPAAHDDHFIQIQDWLQEHSTVRSARAIAE